MTASPAGGPAQPVSHVSDHGHSHLGLALLVIATAQLMIILDASIVNIALPSIQQELEFSPENLTWVINAYTLAFGGFLLLGGRAGDLFGRRRMFIIGILLFTFASLLCGLANSEFTLIAARVVQGLGGAIASPTALALIATTFPEGSPRNRAMAVYAAMSGAGAAVGLIAGGLLTDYLNWRWVFFVNLPIGLFIAFVAPRVLGESKPEPGRIDVLGAIVGTAGLTILVYGITRASGAAGWGDSLTVTCFVVSAVLLILFVQIERVHEHPIMPLHLFANRTRAGTYIVMLLVGASIFSMFYFMSLFIQGILQYSPVRAGVAFLPFTLGIVLGAGIASQLSIRVPPRFIASVGISMAIVAMFLNARLEPESTYWPDLLVPMLIMSTGMGLVFVPLTLTALTKVRHEESGIASAVLNTMQQVGGSLGLAVLATIAATATNNALSGAADLYAGIGAGLVPPPTDPGAMEAIVAAVTDGYTTAFYVAGFMLIAGLILTIALIDAPAQTAEEERSTEQLG